VLRGLQQWSSDWEFSQHREDDAGGCRGGSVAKGDEDTCEGYLDDGAVAETTVPFDTVIWVLA
jgi:hypothetical protein